MRIAVLSTFQHDVGGVERYLEGVMRGLVARGHEIAFLYEIEEERTRTRTLLSLPEGVPSICVAPGDRARSLAAIEAWAPDVVYAHCIPDPELRLALAALAPSVFFVHTYVGTCVSGLKAHSFPSARPCDRKLGVACLALYHARRCGGLNPVTMLRQYRRAADDLHALRSFDTVLANSTHMRDECRRHGVAAECVPLFVDEGHAPADAPAPRRLRASGEVRLLFLGRVERLKGGGLLLDALPRVRRGLERPVRAIFAGVGNARSDWEARARRLTADDPDLAVEFVGWVGDGPREELYRASDLLVVPSVWPEPFGLVGLEAAAYGLPAVAFAVGGIPDWLEHGRNGLLATALPPSAEALGDAVVECLGDESLYAELSRGALATVPEFSLSLHLDALVDALARTAGRSARRAVATT